jgi:hypothetical protein
MSAIGEGFMGVLIAVLASVIVGGVFYALQGYQAAYIHYVEQSTTLVAGIEVKPGTWIVEVVWTYKPVIKGFILANGGFISVDSSQVTLIQCGLGYAPAQYRYCIYQVQASSQPIEVVG